MMTLPANGDSSDDDDSNSDSGLVRNPHTGEDYHVVVQMNMRMKMGEGEGKKGL